MKNIKYLAVIATILLLFTTTTTFAVKTPTIPDSSSNVGTPAQSSNSEVTQAENFIKGISTEVISIMTSSSFSAEQKKQNFLTWLKKGFNISYVGKMALNRYWNEASAQEQEEYLSLFEKMIFQVYYGHFEQYSGEQIQVTGSRLENNNAIRVTSVVNRPGKDSVNVDWMMTGSNGSYKIYDVVVDKLSLSRTQQQQVSSTLRSSGGTIPALISKMQEKFGNAY